MEIKNFSCLSYGVVPPSYRLIDRKMEKMAVEVGRELGRWIQKNGVTNCAVKIKRSDLIIDGARRFGIRMDAEPVAG